MNRSGDRGLGEIEGQGYSERNIDDIFDMPTALVKLLDKITFTKSYCNFHVLTLSRDKISLVFIS